MSLTASVRSKIDQFLRNVTTLPPIQYLPSIDGWKSEVLTWGGKRAAYDELFFLATELNLLSAKQGTYADRLLDQGSFDGSCELYTLALQTRARASQAETEAIAVWERGATVISEILFATADTSCTIVRLGLKTSLTGDIVC